MDSVPVNESMLAIMLSVGFLAAAVLGIACYRPSARRGDAIDSFLLVAGLALIGTSAGFGVAVMASAGYGTLGSYGPAFLLIICITLIATAVYTFRGRS